MDQADAKIPIAEHVGLLRDEIRKKATSHRELQAKLGRTPDKFIPIAMDEWNYWHRDYVYGELGCQYDLADALGIAAGLHEYFRNSDIIHMAHYAQTVNVIGCIKTTKTAAFFDTTALPLLLYRREFGTRAARRHRQSRRARARCGRRENRRRPAQSRSASCNPQAKPQTIEIAVRGAKIGSVGPRLANRRRRSGGHQHRRQAGRLNRRREKKCRSANSSPCRRTA